jgi:hypothetical protein
MHFYLVALKETAVSSVSKSLSINLLYLAGCSDRVYRVARRPGARSVIEKHAGES